MPQVTVEPCENCLEAARDEGRAEKESELEDTITELRLELEEARKNATAQSASCV
jgi:hypothetical protein